MSSAPSLLRGTSVGGGGGAEEGGGTRGCCESSLAWLLCDARSGVVSLLALSVVEERPSPQLHLGWDAALSCVVFAIVRWFIYGFKQGSRMIYDLSSLDSGALMRDEGRLLVGALHRRAKVRQTSHTINRKIGLPTFFQDERRLKTKAC